MNADQKPRCSEICTFWTKVLDIRVSGLRDPEKSSNGTRTNKPSKVCGKNLTAQNLNNPNPKCPQHALNLSGVTIVEVNLMQQTGAETQNISDLGRTPAVISSCRCEMHARPDPQAVQSRDFSLSRPRTRASTCRRRCCCCSKFTHTHTHTHFFLAQKPLRMPHTESRKKI